MTKNRKRWLRLVAVTLLLSILSLLIPLKALAAGSYTWSSSIASGGNCYLMSASDDGKYAICGGGGSDLVTTSDFGATWTDHASLGSHTWRGMAVSATGQFMAATIGNGELLWSSNYGVTFAAVSNAGTQAWANVDISANGQYIAALYDLDKVMISANGGTTWSTINVSGASELYAMAMSNSGQYMYASDAGSNPSRLYRSTDFGANWAPAVDATMGYMQGVSTSPSGQHVVATSTFDVIFVSHDYGATWTNITTGSASVYYAAISADGQTLIAPDVNPGNLISISYDAGSTWIHDSGLGGTTNFWWNVVGSADLSRVIISTELNGEVFTGFNPALVPSATPVVNDTSPANTPGAPNTGSGQVSENQTIPLILIISGLSVLTIGVRKMRQLQ